MVVAQLRGGVCHTDVTFLLALACLTLLRAHDDCPDGEQRKAKGQEHQYRSHGNLPSAGCAAATRTDLYPPLVLDADTAAAKAQGNGHPIRSTLNPYNDDQHRTQ
jgi:hypothetical protein